MSVNLVKKEYARDNFNVDWEARHGKEYICHYLLNIKSEDFKNSVGSKNKNVGTIMSTYIFARVECLLPKLDKA